MPANVYEDWLRGPAAGFSRRVLSILEPGVDDSASRRADDCAIFGFAATRSACGVGRSCGAVALQDLSPAHAAGAGGAVSRVCKIPQDTGTSAADAARAGDAGSDHGTGIDDAFRILLR